MGYKSKMYITEYNTQYAINTFLSALRYALLGSKTEKN